METEIQKATMTTYELLALIMSALALVFPFIQWIWKKWIVKADLKHYQTGHGYLFINRSGSYMRIQSVFEAINKPVSIKNISLCITREHDNQQRNLSWSVFTSPTNMQFIGNNAFMNEIAHPFRIEANHVFCAFTEYTDQNRSTERTLSPYFTKLHEVACEYPLAGKIYNQSVKEYLSTDEYQKAKQALEKELFWTIGKYKAEITAQYGSKAKCFLLRFDIMREQESALKSNIDEMLLFPLKELYKVSPEMQAVEVQLSEE